jgi:hypothetical protein
MTAQSITISPPVAPSVGRSRHRRLRVAAAIAGVAAAIASGGYLAATKIGPDSVPATGTDVIPNAQAERELRDSTAGQYGSRSATQTTVNPSAQALRDLHASVAGQYGIRPATEATLSPSVQALRDFRHSVARQYGQPR